MSFFNILRVQLICFVLFLIIRPAEAQSNQYLHFDGVDDYVLVENASQYFSGTNQLTLTGWFFTDELLYGQGYMGFRSGSGNAEFYMIQLNNGVMECRLKTTTQLYEYVAPANTAIPQTWQHFAWVFDVNRIYLYVNGVLKGSAAAGGTFSGTNTPFAIGKSPLGNFNFVYKGGIDEVSVWKKALSADEIKDIMQNEIDKNADGLGLYYKFNQGAPGVDNTSITHLRSEVFPGERDGQLLNFALKGTTSNFVGELDEGFQAITFDAIPDKLTTDAPFTVSANASSGLPVTLSIVSGPATISGNTITLTGEAGPVTVLASQDGNADWDPASNVLVTFNVYDPKTTAPTVEMRHPLAGEVSVPKLGPINLAAIAGYGNNALFNMTDCWFEVDGQRIDAYHHGNGHYTAWWTPTEYGNKTIAIKSTNNYGYSFTDNTNINIISEAYNTSVTAVQGLWLNAGKNEAIVEVELPSFIGAYNNVTANFQVKCPSGGCGEWDRESFIEVKGHDGKWYEIMHYITPYSKACAHTIDLTDYISLLQGKVAIRYVNETLDNGYDYNLELEYTAGTPEFIYSQVTEIWHDRYPFGDYANLQPVPPVSTSFAENTQAAKLKLISPGHGWGDLNTSNAAEFYDATHHVLVNGAEKFTQRNWATCNPNPDNCQPQNGTWYYNRSGWCPGALVRWFDFDMTEFVAVKDVTLQYKLFEGYVDFCHPNHPNCVSGVTCSDCNDSFNPVLAVACNLVQYSNAPFPLEKKSYEAISDQFMVSPNPTTDVLNISSLPQVYHQSMIQIFSTSGQKVLSQNWDGYSSAVDVSALSPGIYVLAIVTQNKTFTQKVVIF